MNVCLIYVEVLPTSAPSRQSSQLNVELRRGPQVDAIAEQMIEAALASLKGHNDAAAPTGSATNNDHNSAYPAVDMAGLFRGTEAQIRFAARLLNERIAGADYHLEVTPAPMAAGYVGQLEVGLTRNSTPEAQLQISVDHGGKADCRMTVRADTRKMRAFNIQQVDQAQLEQLLATFFSKSVSETGRMV